MRIGLYYSLIVVPAYAVKNALCFKCAPSGNISIPFLQFCVQLFLSQCAHHPFKRKRRFGYQGQNLRFLLKPVFAAS